MEKEKPGSKFAATRSNTVKPSCHVCSDGGIHRGEETSFIRNWVDFNSYMAGSKKTGKEVETGFQSWFSKHSYYIALEREASEQVGVSIHTSICLLETLCFPPYTCFGFITPC